MPRSLNKSNWLSTRIHTPKNDFTNNDLKCTCILILILLMQGTVSKFYTRMLSKLYNVSYLDVLLGSVTLYWGQRWGDLTHIEPSFLYPFMDYVLCLPSAVIAINNEIKTLMATVPLWESAGYEPRVTVLHWFAAQWATSPQNYPHHIQCKSFFFICRTINDT